MQYPYRHAWTTRVALDPPRPIHGERERRLARPARVSPLRGGTPAVTSRGTRPGHRDVRRSLLQPAIPGLRDRRDHRPRGGLPGRGRSRRGADGAPGWATGGHHPARAGGPLSGADEEVPQPPRRGTLGSRRRRDRRGGTRPLRAGDLWNPRPSRGRSTYSSRNPRRCHAGLPEGSLRAGDPTRRPAGPERLDHTRRVGSRRPARTAGVGLGRALTLARAPGTGSANSGGPEAYHTSRTRRAFGPRSFRPTSYSTSSLGARLEASPCTSEW